MKAVQHLLSLSMALSVIMPVHTYAQESGAVPPPSSSYGLIAAGIGALVFLVLVALAYWKKKSRSSMPSASPTEDVTPEADTEATDEEDEDMSEEHEDEMSEDEVEDEQDENESEKDEEEKDEVREPEAVIEQKSASEIHQPEHERVPQIQEADESVKEAQDNQ